MRLLIYILPTMVFLFISGFNNAYADLTSGNIIQIATDSQPDSWTSIIPISLNDDGVTDLLFHSSSENILEFYTVTRNGTMTLVKTHTDIVRLSIIVPVNLNNDGTTDLLIYFSSGGFGDFYTVEQDGTMHLKHRNTGWDREWTSIIPINLDGEEATDLLFYSESLNRIEFNSVGNNGLLTNVATHTNWPSKLSSIVPMRLNNDGITDFFFYSPSENKGEFYKGNANGMLTPVVTHDGIDSTWTSIIPTDLNNDEQVTDLLLYSPTAKQGLFSKVTSSGEFIDIKEHNDWPSTWTSIVPINLNGDGLTDFFFYSPSEKKGEFYRLSHFNPNRDRDGDGLSNIWEIEGIDSNFDGRLDIRLPESNVAHKDLYVEVDFMQFHEPVGNTIQHVRDSFSNSPNRNPDGEYGINLHVQQDEQIAHQATTDLDDLEDIKRASFGTFLERSDPNSENIIAAKLAAFHYAVFAHEQPGTTSSGHSNGIPSMEFMITLGSPGRFTDPLTGHPVGTEGQQEGTFMHELGHNLGLQHGGDDDDNCKPNYLSVMSYSRQMPRLIPDRPLDYSRSKIASINEGFLQENDGIKPSVPPGLKTAIGPYPPETVTAGDPVDWNRDGDTTDLNVIADINYVRETGDCSASPPNPEFGELHTGYSDWSHVDFIYIPFCTFCADKDTVVNKQKDVPELTLEEEIEDSITLFGRIEDEIKSLPNEVFKNNATASKFKGDFDLLLGNKTAGFKVLLKTGDPRQAAAMLEQLKSKTDSSIGGDAADDLITDANAQQKVLPLIDDLILSLTR